MIERFAQFPKALASQSRTVLLGPSRVPAMLAHPDWQKPAPVMIWMHGRTVHKELDPGRYLRWIRAGIAACSIDLPGHGERLEDEYHDPDMTPETLGQVIPEIDEVVEALAGPEFEVGGAGVFDIEQMGLGGVSAGGMATLRRLCDPHHFKCAAVEATTGWLADLYRPDSPHPLRVTHPPERIAALDPMEHLDTWRPIPLLALHSEADELVPFAGQAAFIEKLRCTYDQAGADPSLVELVTWPQTGAPLEHMGFGKLASEAKKLQTQFLAKHLSVVSE